MFDNERWKSDGDCSICRRKEYCNKDCSAHQHRVNRMIKKAFFNSVSSKILTVKTLAVNNANNYLEEGNYKEK